MEPRKVDPVLVDNAARVALNAILWKSIEETKEYGGMMYLQGDKCLAMPPRTTGDPTKVDVGQREPNCSCPVGTTPIAYYHTHPTFQVAGFKADYNEFSDNDKDVARDFHLMAAYLGSLDGTFKRFDVAKNLSIPLPGRLRNTK